MPLGSLKLKCQEGKALYLKKDDSWNPHLGDLSYACFLRNSLIVICLCEVGYPCMALFSC